MTQKRGLVGRMLSWKPPAAWSQRLHREDRNNLISGRIERWRTVGLHLRRLTPIYDDRSRWNLNNLRPELTCWSSFPRRPSDWNAKWKGPGFRCHSFL